MKTVHYTSGLPRSCSTLLQNLLAQNPLVHATATSGVHEVMYLSKAFFKTEEFRSIPNPTDGEKLFTDFMRAGISNAFDSLTDRFIVVDKCRSWIGSAGLLFKLFPEAKLLVPVRDIRGVLSSMEKKFQQHPEFQLEMSQQDTVRIQTVEGRCGFWLDTAPVGLAIQRIHELARLHKDKVLFVHAENLASDPQGTMDKVWKYLGMEAFQHDPSNVAQYTKEHELGWPYGEHIIRSEVKPLKPDFNDTLGRQLSETINQKFNWVPNL
ncbi:sulfotransferase family protein [Propionivibrio sp.]|uniref:sulfotransferase family protein n=1 Tax=Propionivibrio sp. TaxID=2212460 RepID=UPI003BF02732